MIHEHRRTRKPASIQLSASLLRALTYHTQLSVVGPVKPTYFEYTVLETVDISGRCVAAAGTRTP